MANEMRLIDIAQCEKYGHACLMYTEEDGSLVQTFTSAFPTIDPETLRPKGRWVNERILIGGLAEVWGYDCSVCGKTTEIQKYNYCPHCGARMEDCNG